MDLRAGAGRVIIELRLLLEVPTGVAIMLEYICHNVHKADDSVLAR
jgi:hypothetical protein